MEYGKRYDTREFLEEQFYEEVLKDELREDGEATIVPKFKTKAGLNSLRHDYAEMIEEIDFEPFLGHYHVSRIKIKKDLTDEQIEDLCKAVKWYSKRY